MGIAIAQVIPAGAHEGIHSVRFPLRGLAAGRAGHAQPLLLLGQGRAALAAEGAGIGQLHWQLGGWHRHHAAAGAVDHRNWATPVALSGDQPIAQPVLHPALAPAPLLRRLGDRQLGLATF